MQNQNAVVQTQPDLAAVNDSNSSNNKNIGQFIAASMSLRRCIQADRSCTVNGPRDAVRNRI
jgi:hypothetical protein